MLRTFKAAFPIAFGLSFCFYACGGDSSSGSSDDSSSSTKLSSGISDDYSSISDEESSGDSKPNSSSANAPLSSSSAKQETVSGTEALNDASKTVTGNCAPNPAKIEKGGIVTWEFLRSKGEVWDQILAPFVWTFSGTNVESLQGNGLSSVNVRYENSGTHYAELNVDGNLVECSPLQVQGIPITVESCSANKQTANVGETVIWNVSATSESPITEYSWESSFGKVSGNGAEGSLVITSDMHKKSVTATVTVTNADLSAESYVCEGVTAIDPESVDLVLKIGDVNNADLYGEPILPTLPDSLFIPGGRTPMVVQIPAGAKQNCAISCKPRVGSDYMSTEVFWDGDETPLSNFAYFNPSGCAPGKKYSVESKVTIICLVNP